MSPIWYCTSLEWDDSHLTSKIHLATSYRRKRKPLIQFSQKLANYKWCQTVTLDSWLEQKNLYFPRSYNTLNNHDCSLLSCNNRLSNKISYYFCQWNGPSSLCFFQKHTQITIQIFHLPHTRMKTTRYCHFHHRQHQDCKGQAISFRYYQC